MNKKTFPWLFLLCLGGGIIFGTVFFFCFGAQIGFPWYWALICAALGLFFAVTFYFVWRLVEKFSKPFSLENVKAQRKLLEYESMRAVPYEEKVCAYMDYGRGLRQEFCETCLYFEQERIHAAFCHFGKIYTLDIPYRTLSAAVIAFKNHMILVSDEVGYIPFLLKERTPRLKELFTEKEIPYEEEEPLETEESRLIERKPK